MYARVDKRRTSAQTTVDVDVRSERVDASMLFGVG